MSQDCCKVELIEIDKPVDPVTGPFCESKVIYCKKHRAVDKLLKAVGRARKLEHNFYCKWMEITNCTSDCNLYSEAILAAKESKNE